MSKETLPQPASYKPSMPRGAASRIRSVNIEEHILRFRKPFSIAYETAETARIVIVRLEDEEGREGLGAAAPDPEVTSETVERSFTALKRILTPDFFPLPIDRIPDYHRTIAEAFRGLPAAQSAAEEALLSLVAKQGGLSLSALLGGTIRSHCKATVTVGILDEETTVREVGQRLGEGFTCIKLKCGLNLHSDLKRIERIRNMLPLSYSLLLDANQGYTRKEAQELLETMRDWNVALIEQPIAAADREGLKRLHHMNAVPVIADESAVTKEDTVRLLREDCAAGVNIKLMKCGGPLNAVSLIRFAKDLQKIVILGCMYESNISLTTAACLALAHPVDYADLDSGPLDFANDPGIGGMAIRNGNIFLNGPLSLKEHLV